MKSNATIDNKINELRKKMAEVQGTNTEVYTRIVGYYRSVNNWNKGKRDEYDKRKLFSQPDKINLQNAAETAMSPSLNKTAETKTAVLSESSAPAGYIFFYRTTCPNCPPVSNWLKNSHLKGEAINVDDKAGFDKAAEYQIFASPTVVFLNEEGKEMYRATNTKALDAIFAGVTV